MNLKQLEYVIAMAEERSVSKAARRLYLSPSALSQYISRLETEEHLPPLFRREKGEYHLTDAGRIYVNGARTILNLSANMEHALKDHQVLVRLALAPVFEYSLLTRVLPRFRQSFPETELSVSYCSSSQAKHRLDEGQADVAVVLDQQKTYSSFRYAPIYEDQVVWAAGSGIWRAGKQKALYKSLPAILPPEGTFWRGTCDDILSQEQFTGTIYCETTDLNVIAALLADQPVTAFLLESAFGEITCREKGDREDQGEEVILPLSRRYPYYISVLTPFNQTQGPAAAGLVELMTEYLNPFRHPIHAGFPAYRRVI